MSDGRFNLDEANKARMEVRSLKLWSLFSESEWLTMLDRIQARFDLPDGKFDAKKYPFALPKQEQTPSTEKEA